MAQPSITAVAMPPRRQPKMKSLLPVDCTVTLTLTSEPYLSVPSLTQMYPPLFTDMPFVPPVPCFCPFPEHNLPLCLDIPTLLCLSV